MYPAFLISTFPPLCPQEYRKYIRSEESQQQAYIKEHGKAPPNLKPSVNHDLLTEWININYKEAKVLETGKPRSRGERDARVRLNV